MNRIPIQTTRQKKVMKKIQSQNRIDRKRAKTISLIMKIKRKGLISATIRPIKRTKRPETKIQKKGKKIMRLMYQKIRI